MAAIELFLTPLFNDVNLKTYWRLESNSNDSKGSYNGIDTSVAYDNAYGKFNKGAYYNGSANTITSNYNQSAKSL